MFDKAGMYNKYTNMLSKSTSTDTCRDQSIQYLRQGLEDKGILFLELDVPRRTGKTTMLNSLALGYSQLKDNRVLLMTNHLHCLGDVSLYNCKNIDIILSGRIKHRPESLWGIKYDVILIDELHGFTIPELVQKLQLDIRAHSLKVLVIVK